MEDRRARLILLTLSFCLISSEARPSNKEKSNSNLEMFLYKQQTPDSINGHQKEIKWKLEYPRSLQKRTVGQCTCPDGQNCACAKEGPSIEDVIEVIVSNGQEDIPEVPVGIDPSIARIRQEQVEEQTDGERSVVNTQHLIPKEKGTEEIGHRLMEAKRNLGNQVTPGNSNKGDKPGCLCPEKGNDECACQEETVDGQQNQKKSIIAVI